MDFKMREVLITFCTFLLGFLVESRVLYSNTKDGMVADSASMNGLSPKSFDHDYRYGKNNTTSLSHKSYNEVNSSPWDLTNLLGGRDINNEPQTEFGQILSSLQGLSTELQV